MEESHPKRDVVFVAIGQDDVGDNENTKYFFQSKAVKGRSLFLGMKDGKTDPEDKVIGIIESKLDSILANSKNRFSTFFDCAESSGFEETHDH